MNARQNHSTQRHILMPFRNEVSLQDIELHDAERLALADHSGRCAL